MGEKISADDVIKKKLQSGRKTPSELRQTCLSEGIPPSTYHRHLKNLVKMRVVKEERYYELAQQELEADAKEVDECLNILKNSPNEEVRLMRAKELIILCRKKAAHLPGLLGFFETSLSDPCKEVREKLVFALFTLIFYERRRVPVDEGILKRIIEGSIETMKEFALKDPCIPVRKNAICFLEETGDIHALDTIFEIVKNSDEKVYEDLLFQIEEALLSPVHSWLFKNHKPEIRKRLDELLTDPSDTIRKRAKELWGKYLNKLAEEKFLPV